VWNGAVVAAGSPFTWVFAEWVIPEVLASKFFWADDFAVGFWVGIDGFSMYSPDVLQAGVRALVTTKWFWYVFPYTEVEYSVWTEWWTVKYQDPSVTVSNFPVKPGQMVSFVVCAPQPGDSASVFIANASTGMGTSVQVPVPGGDTTSQGSSAEWIVEGKGAYLPPFNPITFNDCWAGRPNNSVDLRDAFPVPDPEAGPDNLTDVQIVQPHSVVVQWKAEQ
jgi:hypothetical protein